MADMSKMEGYVELVGSLLARVPRSRLAGLLAKVPPEVLAQLPAEKRLAGLSVDERLAGLSADELDALATKLRRRAGRSAKARRPLAR
jgi:hypothetical protein